MSHETLELNSCVSIYDIQLLLGTKQETLLVHLASNPSRKDVEKEGLNPSANMSKNDFKNIFRQIERKITQENERRAKQERVHFERKLTELKKIMLKQLKQDAENQTREVKLMKKEFRDQLIKTRNSILQELERSRQQLLSPAVTSTNYHEQLLEQKNGYMPPEHDEKTSPSSAIQGNTIVPVSKASLEESLNRLKLEILNQFDKRDMKHVSRTNSLNRIPASSNSKLLDQEDEIRNKDAEIARLNEQIREFQDFQTNQSPQRLSRWEVNNPDLEEAKEVEKINSHEEMQQGILDIIKEISREKEQNVPKVQEPLTQEAKRVSLASKVTKKFGLVNSLM